MLKINKTICRRIVAIFVVVFVGFFAFNVLLKFASAEPVKQITLTSNANYANREEGAWKIDESAKILSQNKVQVKYDVDSILKGDGKKKDIFIMTDISGSMTGERIAQHRSVFQAMLPTLLVDGNRVAMGTFNHEASLFRDFTTNGANLAHEIGMYFPSPGGGTSYYKAFKFLNEFFADYEPAENTSLIILFMTDGAPMEDTPGELAEYQIFKNRHPYATVQGVQYELGDEVIPGIAAVSDNQFISNMDNFEDVLFEAASDGYKYDEFQMEYQLNNEYYSIDSVEATMGTVDTTDGKITWSMNGQYRSGTKQSLTVNLTAKDACLATEEARCKVNTRSIITSKLHEASDERIDTADSVIPQFKYDVSYDFNAPEGCSIDSSLLPATSKELIFSTVGVSDNRPSCNGYTFKAWSITNDNAMRVNDDYFIMPEGDTVIRAIWNRPSISKSMEGTVAPTTTAMLNTGRRIGATPDVPMSTAEHLEFTDTLPIDFTPTDSNTVSTRDSELPVYSWYDTPTKTIYFYSDADIIYMNPNSSSFLFGLYNLKDISGLSHLNASKVENLYYAFASLRDNNLDLGPIAGWDTSSVTSLYSTFRNLATCDLTPLAEWDVSSVTDMTGTFAGRPSGCTTLEGLEDWDVSSVETMNETFASGYIEDISALADWNTASLKDMGGLFVNSNIKSATPLAGWDTSKVTSMYRLFDGTAYLTNLNGLEDWDVKKVESLEHAFRSSGVSDISALASWETNSLTNLGETFNGVRSITSLAAIKDWDVSRVTTLNKTFTGTSVTSLQPLKDWDVSSVTDLGQTFQISTLTSMDGVEDWDTSKVVSLYYTFHPNIVDIDALEDWDVRKVSNMRGIFASTKLASLAPLYKWQTNSLENLIYAFEYAYNLTNLHGLENWDVTKLKNADVAFKSLSNLTTLEALADWETNSLQTASTMFSELSSLVSLHGLEDWDVSNVTNAGTMFASNKNLENIDALSDWRFVALTGGGLDSFLSNNPKITSLEPIRNLGIGNVTQLKSVFSGCKGITDFEPISGWDVSKVVDLDSLFVDTSETNLNDLSGWDVSKVKNLNATFARMPYLNNISGLSQWSLPLLETMRSTFSGDGAVTSLSGIESWGTIKLGNIESAFKNMTMLSDISALSTWNVGNVQYIYGLFAGDSSLTSVEALRNWNVESVRAMNDTFNGCSGVLDFTPLNSWPLSSAVSRSDRTNSFANTNSAAVLPAWYYD